MRFLPDRFLIRVILISAVIIAAMFILRIWMNKRIHTEEKPSSALLKPLPSPGPFRVKRVIDGDTIMLDNGQTIRLIGVDAPETHHPEIPAQRFGTEATQFLKQLIEGFECTLEFEPDNLKDRYGRSLAYVFINGRLANSEIIRRGYAYAYTRFPFRRQAQFIALEREARKRQYGLWNLSLKDGRLTNLITRYEALNIEGRRRLDDVLKELTEKYPYINPENNNNQQFE